MKISYDPKADALYIKFQDGSVARTRKVEEGMLVDVARRPSLRDRGHRDERIPIPGSAASSWTALGGTEPAGPDALNSATWDGGNLPLEGLMLFLLVA
jgi:hypothetical protein